MEVVCKNCGAANRFEQPHPYHAGFANQGFLYNEEGNLTLVWSSFDSAYEEIVGECHPWALSSEQRRKLEDRLAVAPKGGKWLFRNAARCLSCSSVISRPMTEHIYYVAYPGSLVLDSDAKDRNLVQVLQHAL